MVKTYLKKFVDFIYLKPIQKTIEIQKEIDEIYPEVEKKIVEFGGYKN